MSKQKASQAPAKASQKAPAAMKPVKTPKVKEAPTKAEKKQENDKGLDKFTTDKQGVADMTAVLTVKKSSMFGVFHRLTTWVLSNDIVYVTIGNQAPAKCRLDASAVGISVNEKPADQHNIKIRLRPVDLKNREILGEALTSSFMELKSGIIKEVGLELNVLSWTANDPNAIITANVKDVYLRSVPLMKRKLKSVFAEGESDKQPVSKKAV